MKRWLITIAGLCLLLFILNGCNPNRSKYKVIPKKDFIKILVKWHLAEGIASSYFFRDSFKYIKKINLPDSVIVQYGYTRAVFDSTISYYTTYPKDYDAIYDQVINELNKIKTQIEKSQKKEVPR
jgi:hypothetical protein